MRPNHENAIGLRMSKNAGPATKSIFPTMDRRCRIWYALGRLNSTTAAIMLEAATVVWVAVKAAMDRATEHGDQGVNHAINLAGCPDGNSQHGSLGGSGNASSVEAIASSSPSAGKPMLPAIVLVSGSPRRPMSASLSTSEMNAGTRLGRCK